MEWSNSIKAYDLVKYISSKIVLEKGPIIDYKMLIKSIYQLKDTEIYECIDLAVTKTIDDAYISRDLEDALASLQMLSFFQRTIAMEYKVFFINLNMEEASEIYHKLPQKEKFIVDKIYNEYHKEDSLKFTKNKQPIEQKQNDNDLSM